MRMNAPATWLTLLLGCLLTSVCCANITLVDKGVANATIIVAKEAIGAPTEPDGTTFASAQPRPNKIAAAACDLQTYIEKMSGAALPIIGDDQPVPKGNLILVGHSALTKALDTRIPSGLTPARDEEGYLLLTNGNRLLVAGNDESPYHGTEYAADALLHRLGVRWYMPSDFGDFVPKRATITIDDLHVLSKPDFKMRNWWCGVQSVEHAVVEYRWKIRNGMNPMLDFIAIPGDGTVRSVLPPADKLNDPALADVWGKTEAGKLNETMPNLTSEASVQYAAEQIKAYFRTHPTVTSYGMAPDDGIPMDFSPGTMKRNLGMPSIGGRLGVTAELNTTDEWMAWVQQVAQEVRKEFPDRVITTNGYANRNTPPITITADPNIWIMFAAIWSDTMHAYDNPRSWQTNLQGKMIEGWAKQYKNVYMYNYIYWMLAGSGAPIPLAHKHMHDMPLYKKWGVVGFDDEGRTMRGESGVFPTYLRARMMWDASLDGKKEMDEFFANWYGPAAKPAMAFWEELENTFENTPWIGHEDRILPYVYSQDLVDRMEKHLKEAEALATSSPHKEHVLADHVVLDHLKAYLAMNRAEFDADFAKAARQAQRMMDVRKPAAALSSWYFDTNPQTGDVNEFYYWSASTRRLFYQKLDENVNGKLGAMVAILPEAAKCKLDPHDEGRYNQWYARDLAEAGWTTVSSTVPFYRQVAHGVDAQGYPYMGAFWYRLDVEAPAIAPGKKVYLACTAIEPEAWIWVNGQYVGHRGYHEAYERGLGGNFLDMDVTKALIPGKKNQITIRIHTGMNAAQMSDGLISRLFLYTPNDKPILEQ